MTKVRARGEQIRKFILENVNDHCTDIGKVTSDKFGITRQAANKHLKKLVLESALGEDGSTKAKVYNLIPLLDWDKSYSIFQLEEDQVWVNDIKPILGNMPYNVMRIWGYGFTEMLNNVIDHSEGTKVTIRVKKTSKNAEISIHDNGIGIFKKIQTKLKLLDERHAILELAKGKLTTDPKRHSGEGIFFSSRMFDSYVILSGGVFFSHEFEKPEDWILERKEFKNGTSVFMELNNHTSRTIKKIFDQFNSGDNYGFNKTVVPVRLAQYGNDELISRSQAKRLLARVELFKTVMFDFEDVDFIGQAFADEIFRVFAAAHPSIKLMFVKAKPEVKQMIDRAQGK